MLKDCDSSKLNLEMAELVINGINGNGINGNGINGDGDHKEEKKFPKQIMMFDVCDNFIKDINNFGISVMDGFLGEVRGNQVYEEVLQLQDAGLFQKGKLVKNHTRNNSIRGDEIVWLRGNEDAYPYICDLIGDIDRIIMTSFRIPNNGQLRNYTITGRTKAMVACYPGNGAHYVKHVDNPNGDGRVITAIYYLNKGWNREAHGGMLRIFPADERAHAADIDPLFDRMLFFWSDRRNPHEVQPSYRTRYAITIWYFDGKEREEALKRRQSSQNEGKKANES